jgi:hypothetical protein
VRRRQHLNLAWDEAVPLRRPPREDVAEAAVDAAVGAVETRLRPVQRRLPQRADAVVVAAEVRASPSTNRPMAASIGSSLPMIRA